MTWIVRSLIAATSILLASAGFSAQPGSPPHAPRPNTGEHVTILLPGGVPLQMQHIPAGSFIMGSHPEERGNELDEIPQTQVKLTRDFYLGKYPVTQRQWYTIMNRWPPQPYVPSEDYGLGDNVAMYYMSWQDAQDFVSALNAHLEQIGETSMTVRMPTEAEWEYACRAGTTTRFSFGDSLTVDDECQDDGLRSQHMWFCGNSALQREAVGQKLPNAFGLHDMHGNVGEWVYDWHASRLPGWRVSDPIGPPSGTHRVLRGGYTFRYAYECRSANRTRLTPATRAVYTGFRLAATPRDTPPPAEPAAPLTNAATNIFDRSFTANWTPVPEAMEYRLDVSTNDSFTAIVPGYDSVQTANSTNWTVTGLNPGTTYYFRVRAVNSLGKSVNSNPTPVTTSSSGASPWEERVINLPGNVPLVLVRVPAGSFTMGASAYERGFTLFQNEGPETDVQLTRDFYMGKYPVTQSQWQAVMGAGNWPGGRTPSDSFGMGDDHPVYSVSWNDAQEFLTALSNHITATGQGPLAMRLPSEAEWEYSCRAGTTTRFHFGDSIVESGSLTSNGDRCEDEGIRSEFMWYCANNDDKSQPVGQKRPNAFGLFDMHGNVLEWCEDWYAEELPGGSVTDPQGPTSGTERVGRGYGGQGTAEMSRSASRLHAPPTFSLSFTGFRVAATWQEGTTPTPTPVPNDGTEAIRELSNTNWRAVTMQEFFPEPLLEIRAGALELETTAPNSFGYFETRNFIGPFSAGNYRLTASIRPEGPLSAGQIYPELRLRVTSENGLVNHVRADASTQGTGSPRTAPVLFDSPAAGEFRVSVDILRFIDNQRGGYVITEFDFASAGSSATAVPAAVSAPLQPIAANWSTNAFPDFLAPPVFQQPSQGLVITTEVNGTFGFYETRELIGPLAPGTYQLLADLEPHGALSPGQIYPELRLRVTSENGLVNLIRADASTLDNSSPRSLSVLFEAADGNDKFRVSVDILRFLDHQSGGYLVTGFRLLKLE